MLFTKRVQALVSLGKPGYQVKTVNRAFNVLSNGGSQGETWLCNIPQMFF